jgi:hypothetical protein
MNASLIQTTVRRRLVALVVAVMLAVGALSVPVLADMAGVPLVSTVYACQNHGGGCG